MSPETLRRKMRQALFAPFEVVMSSGSRYQVKGPEDLVVGTRTSALWVPGNPDDDLILLDNLHITEAPPLAVPAVA